MFSVDLSSVWVLEGAISSILFLSKTIVCLMSIQSLTEHRVKSSVQAEDLAAIWAQVHKLAIMPS